MPTKTEQTGITDAVKKAYSRIARNETVCCPPGSKVCGSASLAEDLGRKIGYSDEELRAAPKGANLGLGSGNPVASAALQRGEVVLDLGSGPGFDCFLAADKVGKSGTVVGIDITPEMIQKAMAIAEAKGYENVEFRLGEIEHLPAADQSVDVVLSNCVINLSPDKKRVFNEAFRVLRPGGRMVISDIVLARELPGFIKDSVEAYVGCVAGALLKTEYLNCISAAGFQEIEIIAENPFPFDCLVNDPTAKAIIEDARISADAAREVAAAVMSLMVRARKVDGSRS